MPNGRRARQPARTRVRKTGRNPVTTRGPGSRCRAGARTPCPVAAAPGPSRSRTRTRLGRIESRHSRPTVRHNRPTVRRTNPPGRVRHLDTVAARTYRAGTPTSRPGPVGTVRVTRLRRQPHGHTLPRRRRNPAMTRHPATIRRPATPEAATSIRPRRRNARRRDVRVRQRAAARRTRPVPRWDLRSVQLGRTTGRRSTTRPPGTTPHPGTVPAIRSLRPFRNPRRRQRGRQTGRRGEARAGLTSTTVAPAHGGIVAMTP